MTIGSNVTIFQNVTIAEANRYERTTIEDDVIIGAGAVIIRNVRIDKGAKIGANIVILNDVPMELLAILQELQSKDRLLNQNNN